MGVTIAGPRVAPLSSTSRAQNRSVDTNQERGIRQARSAVLRTFGWRCGHADIWRVFRDATALTAVVDALVAPFRDHVHAVAGLESRGFVLGGAAATALGVGFIPIRKAGALFPGPRASTSTGADYRGRRTELMVQRLSIHRHDRVLLVDDWIETGTQVLAAEHLLRECGAEIAGVAVIVDQLTPTGRKSLGTIHALLSADELPPDPEA